MTVERNKNGSITIKDEKSSTTISGVTSEYKLHNIDKFWQWAEQCAKLVKPCAHTTAETEQYFLSLCDTQPLDMENERMKIFQHTVITNHCKDILKCELIKFSFDMSDEDIEKWNKQRKTIREEAMKFAPEHFGLIIHGYFLPHTERNASIYEEVYQDTLKIMNLSEQDGKQIQTQDIYCFFEETTGQYQFNVGHSMANKLIIFMGISEEDIKNRTPRFIQYIESLRDMGELPGMPEE